MDTVLRVVFLQLLWFAIIDGRGHPNPLLCKDELAYKDCKFYRELGFCNTHQAYLYEKCPVTCDLCNYGTDNKKVCADVDGVFNCNYLKQNGVCKTHPDLMAERCAKTCDLCGAKEKCSSIQCPKYQICVLKDNGKPVCECPKYCPYKEQYKELGEVCASNTKTYKDFCHLQHHACREQKDLRVLFYGKCFHEDVCEDGKQEADSACISWKKAGFCEKNVYKATMTKYCKKTCAFCEGKVPDQRSELNCTNSKFGCCWDGTDAPDPKNGSCKNCEDKVPAFCPKFMKQCNSETRRNMKFMKENCPVTCGFCRSEKPKGIQIFDASGKRLYKTQFKN